MQFSMRCQISALTLEQDCFHFLEVCWVNTDFLFQYVKIPARNLFYGDILSYDYLKMCFLFYVGV